MKYLELELNKMAAVEEMLHQKLAMEWHYEKSTYCSLSQSLNSKDTI